MNINDFLKGADKNKLREEFATFQKMLSTPEGRIIKEKLSKLDKNQLKAKLHSLSGDQTPKKGDISKLVNDPNLLKKINELLDNANSR